MLPRSNNILEVPCMHGAANAHGLSHQMRRCAECYAQYADNQLCTKYIGRLTTSSSPSLNV